MITQSPDPTLSVAAPTRPPESEPAPEHLLALRDITLAFGGVKALSGVSLEVARGEIRSVIGPNGAGKSTLINVISGLYAPDSGKIVYSGEEYRSMPVRKLATLGVSRTFQNLALFEGLTVGDNIALAIPSRVGAARRFLGTPAARREWREARARARETALLLGVDAYADRPASGLPYGIRKRVELARALATRPALLLLDEPLAGVSHAEKASIADLIRKARDTLGTTVVLIEHDIAFVLGLSDRITVLDHGVKIAEGTPAAIRTDRAVIEAYLGDRETEDAR